MKKFSGKSLEGFFILLFIASILSSCVSQKEIKYLQKRQKTDTVSQYKEYRGEDYRIQPRDVLYIKIYSLDEKTFLLFNRVGNNINQQTYSDADFYLNGYNVNDSGFIRLPIMGKIYVKDLNVEQAQNLVQQKVDEYLKETTVVVKLVNFRITMLGEVNKPGEFLIYQDKINLFEAVSLANDLTEFANRSEIAIIRKIPGGSQVYYVDMTSNMILNSQYFYLQPNDIVYAPPLGIKRWGTTTFPWALVFAAISTALLLINYFQH